MWKISHQLAKTAQCTPGLRLTNIKKLAALSTEAAQKSDEKTNDTSAPPPRKSGRVFFKLLGISLVGAGGVVGYAWYDANFKKTIEDNVPYSNIALDYLFQYVPPASSVFGSEASRTPLDDKKKSNAKSPLAIESTAKDAKSISTSASAGQPTMAVKETPTVVTKSKKELEKEKAQLELRQREAEDIAENLAMATMIANILSDTEKSVTAAIAVEKAAADATKAHTQQLKQAMEPLSTEMLWETVTDKQQEQADAIWASETTTPAARENLEKLQQLIASGKSNKITKKNKALLDAEAKLNSLKQSLSSASNELNKAQTEANLIREYNDLVKKGREQFKNELESIEPDMKLGQGYFGRMSADELNSLIAHAHCRMEQLQRQLFEQQVMEQHRIQTQLEEQKEADDKVADAMVFQEHVHMAAELKALREIWESDARAEFEKDLRQQLARQAAAHSDHLGEVLRVSQKQLETELNAIMEERVHQERQHFQDSIAEWLERLHCIETAVENRYEKEKRGRKAQELWLACQALQNILRDGRAGASTAEGKLKPIAPEIQAIREASTGNPFVGRVLESIPAMAERRGIWTEAALAERFYRVRQMCRRVAMIDESGGTLFRFFLSYVQSFFVFRSARMLTSDDEVDPSGLDTFVLVDNALYSLESGNLQQAVRFANQLRGEPRRVAAGWLNEAVIFLEAKQAADALLSFASATGLESLV